MKLHVIKTGVLNVNTLVVPTENGKCFVVDPAACSLSSDEKIITEYIKSQNLICEAIILTHTHFDHITGILELKKTFPSAKIFIHKSEIMELSGNGCVGPMNQAVLNFFGIPELLDLVSMQPAADDFVYDGNSFFGWKVIHTPGHTPGSICLYKSKTENCSEGFLISGDTLFDYGCYGRTDMYGGNESEIQKSINKLNKEIPHGTLVYPGHDNYGFKF